jgi:hypothetical protein
MIHVLLTRLPALQQMILPQQHEKNRRREIRHADPPTPPAHRARHRAQRVIPKRTYQYGHGHRELGPAHRRRFPDRRKIMPKPHQPRAEHQHRRPKQRPLRLLPVSPEHSHGGRHAPQRVQHHRNIKKTIHFPDHNRGQNAPACCRYRTYSSPNLASISRSSLLHRSNNTPIYTQVTPNIHHAPPLNGNATTSIMIAV